MNLNKMASQWLVPIFFSIFAIYSAHGEPFQPQVGQAYRIENQFAGKVLVGYLNKLLLNSYSNNDPIKYWAFEKTDDPEVFLVRRYGGGGYLQSPSESGSEAIYNPHVQHPTSDDFKWRIRSVQPKRGLDIGFWTLQNEKTRRYLYHKKDLDAPNLRSGADPSTDYPAESAFQPHRSFFWMIEPIVIQPLETLAVPQGGWPPDALNKCAVLCISNRPNETITFTLTGTPHPLKGEAIYWGSFWNEMDFYIINLNDKALKTPGTYQLEAAGKQATVRIVPQAYTRPYRRKGTGRFNMAEIFDDDLGFVGHWAHLSTWWPKGKASCPAQELGWRDTGDNNKNGKSWETFDPPRPITEKMATKAYSGGWDMTDQNWHEWAMDGNVLNDLAIMFFVAKGRSALQKEIAEEIAYGAKGLLVNQEASGRWRQGVLDDSHWLGTTSLLGGGLASASAALKTQNPTLARQAKTGAQKAWKYIYSHRNNLKEWAIPGEGVMPDGTPMKSWPQGHRHGYVAEYFECAVNIFLLTKDPTAKEVIDDMLERGTINPYGHFKHARGEKFPGEIFNYNYTPVRLVFAMLKYYPVASDAQKEKIRSMCDTYYRTQILSGLDGPTGMFGGKIAGSQRGGQWMMPARLLVSALLYNRFGTPFGRGMLVGERTIDYWMGCNPYSTSLLFGVGDEFQVNGWSSYHALGRQVGLLSRVPKKRKLESSTGTFMSKETPPLGCVQFWTAALFFEKLAPSIQTVHLYPQENFSGTPTALTVGKYALKHLKAYGLDANSLSSMRIPNGFEVVLYDRDDWRGEKKIVQETQPKLGDWNNRTQALEVRKKEI